MNLEQRLRRETRGEVLFDSAARGRYATDASIYQIMPAGVFVPRDAADVAIALDAARELGVPLIPRGAGTSQCGQTIGADGDTINLYYGAADSCMALATGSIRTLFSWLDHNASWGDDPRVP